MNPRVVTAPAALLGVMCVVGSAVAARAATASASMSVSMTVVRACRVGTPAAEGPITVSCSRGVNSVAVGGVSTVPAGGLTFDGASVAPGEIQSLAPGENAVAVPKAVQAASPRQSTAPQGFPVADRVGGLDTGAEATSPVLPAPFIVTLNF